MLSKLPSNPEGDLESALPCGASVSPNETSILLGADRKDAKRHQRNITRLQLVLFLLLFTAVASAVLTAFLVIAHHLAPALDHGRSAVDHAKKYWHGAVASEVSICSEIGVNVMREKNGSAVDAAIAALLCTGVINNFSSGIGGGGFMLIRLWNGSTSALDFREAAPQAASKDMYLGLPKNASSFGIRSIAVPGEIRGLHEAHLRYGRCSWPDLFAPAIRLARDGFRVQKELARRIKRFASVIQADPALSSTWAPDGRPLREGELLKRPNLAGTLEKIGALGADEFYTGALARRTVDFIQQHKGLLTLQDFRDYRAVWRIPIEGTYRGRKVYSIAAPASGAVLIQALNMLEGYDLPTQGNTPLNAHRFIETLKHAYASRMLLGEPKFANATNVTAFEQKMISKEYASMLRTRIDDGRTFPWQHYVNGSEFDPVRDHGTTHISAMDKEGMSVAATSTINLEFGSKMMDAETGILFNDEMDDFSIAKQSNEFQLPPGPNNYIGPGKRPFSSATPTIVTDMTTGVVECVAGATGGSAIISATLQVLVGLLDYGMSIHEAVQAPRMHHQLLPDKVTAEHRISRSVTAALQDKGHTVNRLGASAFWTSVQAIHQSALGWMQAASDGRKRGLASGY